MYIKFLEPFIFFFKKIDHFVVLCSSFLLFFSLKASPLSANLSPLEANFSMFKLWRWYQACLAIHPLKTQMISSGILWGLGDIGAQVVTQMSLRRHSLSQEKRHFKIDWRRVAATSMFGFAFVGPVGNFWYEYLDLIIRFRFLMQPKTVSFVAAKVFADSIIFGPLDLFIFFSYMGLASGRRIDQVREDVKRDILPALIVGGTIWPLIQVVNFRFIPVRYQLLYVNFFCLLDSSFLSWIEQQGDAPWKHWFSTMHSLEKHRS